MKKLIPLALVFTFHFTQAQIKYGNASSTQYHQFLRNGIGSTVYINQVSANSANAIMRLSSGTAVANQNVRFTVENDGKVGIGTTSPSSKLHIEGNPWTGIKIKDVTTTGGRGTRNDYLDGNNDGWRMFFGGHYSGKPLRFAPLSGGTQGAVAFTVLNNGKVGIGITSPISKFHVYNNDAEVAASAGLTIEQDGTGDAKAQYLITGFRRWVTGIDNSDSDKFIIGRGLDWSQGKDLTIDTNGNVGIGTTNPSSILHINSASILPSSSAGMAHSSLMVSGRDGNLDLLSFDDNTTVSNNISFGRYHESTGALIHKFGITSWANTGNTGSNSGDKISFSYGTNKDIWNNSNLMVIEAGGNVGIGTTTPQSKLAVNGQIRATGVKVLADVNSVPDYVFEEDYELTTLKETKAYISENKHLPEIPSAVEIEENGIDLGEMNMRLLKKIEELTLHMIRIDEELQEVKVENKELREKMSGK